MLDLTRPNTSRITRILGGFILILVMSMFIAPGAMAGCNKKGKGKDCPDPGPDPNPPAPGNSLVAFTGSLIQDYSNPGDVDRDCATETGISNASGNYNCMVAGRPDVSMNTQGLTALFKKSHRTICNSFATGLLDPPAVLSPDAGFSYGWTDDCTDGSCAVEVRVTFSGSQILAATSDKADSLDVVMTGTIDTTGDDGNPFLLDQDVFIDNMEFNFKKPGRNRTAGRCMFYTTPAISDPPQIQFTSLGI